MQTGRGFERLVNFTDAVIAIAVTLLVLPLVEIPSELGENNSVWDVFREHGGELLAFLISFLVIWNFWRAHHATIEYFRAYDSTLMSLHMVWLLTIVVLPFMTQLLNSPSYGHNAETVYIGTLLISSLCLLGMEMLGRRRPHLLHERSPEVERWLSQRGGFATAGLLLVALILSSTIPSAGAWPLLLLLLERPVFRIYDRLNHKPIPAG